MRPELLQIIQWQRQTKPYPPRSHTLLHSHPLPLVSCILARDASQLPLTLARVRVCVSSHGLGDVLQSLGSAGPPRQQGQAPRQQQRLRAVQAEDRRRRRVAVAAGPVGLPGTDAAAVPLRLPVQERRGRSGGGGREELAEPGDRVRVAGAGGVLGAVVRAVPDDRAGDRRAGQGVRRQDQVLQGEHRRLPQHRLHLRHPEHPHRAHVQERREEGERHRRRPQDHPLHHHRQVHRQLIDQSTSHTSISTDEVIV